MSCIITSAQGKTILVFDTLAQANAAAAIQNADCNSGDCPIFAGGRCSKWTEVYQRPDGKYYIFKNPNKMTGITSVIAHTEKDFSGSTEEPAIID